MASCLTMRSVASPAQLFPNVSYRQLHHYLTHHKLRLLQLSPLFTSNNPLPFSTLTAAESDNSFLRVRGWIRTTKVSSYLSAKLNAELGPQHLSGNIFGGSLSRTPLAKLHSSPRTAVTESSSCQNIALEEPHIPVLLNEVVEQFAGRNLSVFVDGTLGAAGHSCAIIESHPELQTFIGLDVDPRAHAEARQKLDGFKGKVGLHLVKSNFESVHAVLKSLGGGFEKGGVDGMLLDLGVSSMQIDEPERGFSFLRDGPLDMRMNPGAAVTAEQVVNDWSEDRLGKIIRDYGEERYWRSIARRIAEARTVSRIQTTGQLVDLVGGPRPGRRKGGSARGIHPATRTFQALRIAVNDELGVLERGLPRAVECLAPGGRLAVISFHSLEDRIVKRAFLAAAGRPYIEEEDAIAYSTSSLYLNQERPEPLVQILTRKPIVPSEEEARANSRSRSAKLRVVEKLKG